MFWLYLALFGSSALLWIKTVLRQRSVETIFFFAWSLCAIIYWFVTAPDMRFGSGFFEVFFATGMSFCLHGPDVARRCPRSLVLAAAVVVCFVATTCSVYSLRSPRKSLVWVSAIPSRPLKERVLDDSTSPPIMLYMPESGDQCGNSPLPCATSDLRGRLRIPGDLGGGFLGK
jgi:hypothetical protein